jgi:alginate O-acetyltransferase complex protein AlgJ
MKARTDVFLSLGFVFGLAALGAGSLGALDPRWQDDTVLNGGLQREIEDDLTNKLPFSGTAISLWTALKLAVFGQTSDKVVVGENGWLFTTEEVQRPDPTDFLTEIQTARDILGREGIALVPVIVPDKSRIYADRLPRPRSDAFESRYDKVIAQLNALGLETSDLTQLLSDGRMRADTYMRTDTHWSPFGAELVAKAIAKGLASSGDPNAFSTSLGPEEAFSGDLIPFVDTGMFRDIAGIEEETIAIPQTQRNGGASMLFSDFDTALALVGTSYSARSEFNFAGFLQQETGLELVNFATEGQGPFAPMRTLLESGELFETGARTVIWEIPERYIDPESAR